jgi:hypothetical protein
MYSTKQLQKWASRYLSVFIGLTIFLLPWDIAAASPPVPDTEPDTMIPEIFKEPVLPENPTQLELGASIYFYHCMPCHGERGQGLTDEFRQQWVPDHQNCWASGCHSGRAEDEGFPIPRDVPGLLTLDSFAEPEQLFTYLKVSHPPQNPGCLADSEYWSVTAHLLYISGRASADIHLGPTVSIQQQAGLPDDNQTQSQEVTSGKPDSNSITKQLLSSPWMVIAALTTIILLAALALIWQTQHSTAT